MMKKNPPLPCPFETVRSRLEQQYRDAAFLPESGLNEEELTAEFARHETENPNEPRIVSKAWLLNLLCRRARIAPEPGDYFVGKIEHYNLLSNLRNRWWNEAGRLEFGESSTNEPGVFTAQLDCSSHICPDWENLMTHGVKGIRDRAAQRSGAYYRAVTLAFDGVAALLKRFDAIQPELKIGVLAECLPRTLREALQLTYLYHELVELDGIEVRSMGRFDHIYNSFYLRDLAEGRLTRDTAKELLKYFWIKFFAKTQGKRFGKPFTFGPIPNELTYLSFETYQEMRIVDPKFHLRVSPQSPRDFLRLAAKCIQYGSNGIVLVNNDAQIAMLEQNGKNHADAENYILIGCYEPAVMGKELNCSGAASLNLASPVETLISAGDFPSFDSFFDAYLAKTDANLTRIMDRVRRWEKHWPQINPAPLFSGSMDCCFECGKDTSEAGAVYNTSGICCVGLPDTVDSLAIVRQLVYEEKRCSMPELRAALAADWKGHEALRQEAIHRVPHWGNNIDRVDQLAVRIADFLARRINHEGNARGGVFQAALYGIIGAVKDFGAETGALPDGRLAGEPLTMNTGAVTGRDKNGVTAMIDSVTKLPLSQFPNGTVLDIMLHPSTVCGEKGLDTLIAIVRSHFKQGGMAIQFNIFDRAVLRDAQAYPEKYANLQVRVCGWNVRFIDLAADEQEIFIAKSEIA